MPYCSLEEAWGSDFKNDANYFSKINAPPSSSHDRNPPNLAQKALDNTDKNPIKESSDLDKYFPSYSGGAPSVTHIQTAKSNIVPYQVSLPNNAKRNYRYPVEDVIKDDDNDSALDLLEDNDHDIRFIDKQRRVVPEYEPSYLTSEDYFLYKKYMKLAQKYKEKLRKKYKNFIEEDENNKNVLEGFSNKMSNNGGSNYSIKDMMIIIIVGVFLIFSLDIFVKMGSKMK